MTALSTATIGFSPEVMRGACVQSRPAPRSNVSEKRLKIWHVQVNKEKSDELLQLIDHKSSRSGSAHR
jgi:hypothetical protein